MAGYRFLDEIEGRRPKVIAALVFTRHWAVESRSDVILHRSGSACERHSDRTGITEVHGRCRETVRVVDPLIDPEIARMVVLP
jgi:hypothetical protein